MNLEVNKALEAKRAMPFLALLLCLGLMLFSGCGGKEKEDLLNKLLQEKETSAKFSVNNENLTQQLNALTQRTNILENKIGELTLSLQKCEEKNSDLYGKLQTATNEIANAKVKTPSSTFRISSDYWEVFLKAHDLQYSRGSDGNIVFKIGELKVGLLGQDNSLTLRMNLGKGTTEQANRWNNNKRFSQAYVDSDGNIYIQSDLDLSNLESEEYVKDWFTRFLASVKSFAADYLN
jgi:hypothetical protein